MFRGFSDKVLKGINKRTLLWKAEFNKSIYMEN